MFTLEDYAALESRWGPAEQRRETSVGPSGLIADDLAYVSPWGFDAAQIICSALLLHGEQDQVVPCSHGEWLARRIPGAELWLRLDDGHLLILDTGEAALYLLWKQTGQA